MLVTPAQAGVRGSDAHLPFHSRFAGMARSYCGRSRVRIAATDGRAQQWRTSTRPRAVTLGLITTNPRLEPLGRGRADFGARSGSGADGIREGSPADQLAADGAPSARRDGTGEPFGN
jgi:hypothetical protein